MNNEIANARKKTDAAPAEQEPAGETPKRRWRTKDETGEDLIDFWKRKPRGSNEFLAAEIIEELERELAAVKADLAKAISNHVADRPAILPLIVSAQAERYKKDAERYRFLRNGDMLADGWHVHNHIALKSYLDDELDAAIDAALATTKEQK